MKKASLLPLVIIVVTFLVIPVAFWVLTSINTNKDIQGAKTKKETAGVSIKISSKNGTWDLNKYLCKDKEECVENLFSGKSLDTISGGSVENKYISISYTSDWESYEFLKIFVKPGWGSTVRKFSSSLTENVSGASIEKFIYGGVDYDVVLVPVKSIGASLVDLASFND